MVYLLIPWYLKESIRWDQTSEGVHYISSLGSLALSGFQRAFQACILIAGRTTGFDGMDQSCQARVFSALMSGLSSCAVGVFLYGLRLSVVTSYKQRGGTECVYTEEHGKPTSSQRSEENLHFVGYAWKK